MNKIQMSGHIELLVLRKTRVQTFQRSVSFTFKRHWG